MEAVDRSTFKFTWKIVSFSKLNTKKLYSEVFIVDGNKWRVLIFPKGNKVDKFSIYLDFTDSVVLPNGWTKHAEFSLAVVNHINSDLTIKKDTQHVFKQRESDWGFTSFMPLSHLYDPNEGFLVNDTLLVEVELKSSEKISTREKMPVPKVSTTSSLPKTERVLDDGGHDGLDGIFGAKKPSSRNSDNTADEVAHHLYEPTVSPTTIDLAAFEGAFVISESESSDVDENKESPIHPCSKTTISLTRVVLENAHGAVLKILTGLQNGIDTILDAQQYQEIKDALSVLIELSGTGPLSSHKSTLTRLKVDLDLAEVKIDNAAPVLAKATYLKTKEAEANTEWQASSALFGELKQAKIEAMEMESKLEAEVKHLEDKLSKVQSNLSQNLLAQAELDQRILSCHEAGQQQKKSIKDIRKEIKQLKPAADRAEEEQAKITTSLEHLKNMPGLKELVSDIDNKLSALNI